MSNTKNTECRINRNSKPGDFVVLGGIIGATVTERLGFRRNHRGALVLAFTVRVSGDTRPRTVTVPVSGDRTVTVPV